ncbi:sensor histidine kinase [Pseudomonas sp. Pseusp122]|uniref:sensor histidine kinase n=1 Tax=unclassified Pseudomonas TaxID=196821 RepID=UPI0039A67E80
MTDIRSQNERAMARAASELLVLGQKTLEARAVLAALERTLIETQDRVSDRQHTANLLEVNQQLVMTILAAQADAESLRAASSDGQYPMLRDANEQLVVAALSAQNLQTLAERALDHERKILVVVAHELRNPLTPISLIAGRISRATADELPRFQALLERQVLQLSRLVDDLLDLSRASTGKLRLELSVMDVVPIIQAVIDFSLPMAVARQLKLISHLPEGPLYVMGDLARLEQVFTNILNNAIKYTPRQGIITITVSVDKKLLRLSVADNGIGISANTLPDIFDPFVQDENAVGFNKVGLGIGLTVVRELVESHGGTVIALSDGKDLGSEFVVTLPLAC